MSNDQTIAQVEKEILGDGTPTPLTLDEQLARLQVEVTDFHMRYGNLCIELTQKDSQIRFLKNRVLQLEAELCKAK